MKLLSRPGFALAFTVTRVFGCVDKELDSEQETQSNLVLVGPSVASERGSERKPSEFLGRAFSSLLGRSRIWSR